MTLNQKTFTARANSTRKVNNYKSIFHNAQLKSSIELGLQKDRNHLSEFVYKFLVSFSLNHSFRIHAYKYALESPKASCST